MGWAYMSWLEAHHVDLDTIVAVWKGAARGSDISDLHRVIIQR